MKLDCFDHVPPESLVSLLWKIGRIRRGRRLGRRGSEWLNKGCTLDLSDPPASAHC